MPNAFSILHIVSKDKFFSPFSTLDIYCWEQFIFSASIRCVSPNYAIRLDMIMAIHCEYCIQSFISCCVFISCTFDIKVSESVSFVIVFIEKYRLAIHL